MLLTTLCSRTEKSGSLLLHLHDLHQGNDDDNDDDDDDNTSPKGRWVGETILTVFSREFRAQPRHEYVSPSSQAQGQSPNQSLDSSLQLRPSHHLNLKLSLNLCVEQVKTCYPLFLPASNPFIRVTFHVVSEL